MTSPPAFGIAALTLSTPGDFTSFAAGGSTLTSRSSSVSPPRLHISWECHCFKKKPPASALVIYSVAIFCIGAAVSASSARLSMNALLSDFACLFTSLSRIEYLVCSCSFTRCDLFVYLLLCFLSFVGCVCLYPIFFPFSAP